MKLIFCPKCQDVFKIPSGKIYKRCKCGHVYGKYIDDLNAEISKHAIPIGFDNPSLKDALWRRPEAGPGSEFTAFVIPTDCGTITIMDD